MNTDEYVAVINRNIEWILETINDVRMYRDEQRPDWIIRISTRMATYVLQMQDCADSWQFDLTHKMEIEG